MHLADTGAKVVAVPGNHDSADLFEVLAPYLEGAGVTLVARPRRPEEGGVVTVAAREGSTAAQVACLPFLHEAQSVDFMADSEEWHKSYAQRIRSLCHHYASWMQSHRRRDTIEVLVGHFMVHGAIPSGSERQLHIGEAYMAREDAIPNVSYAALGHIHLGQQAPGTNVPAFYAGSLMQLDFGEAGQDKSVIVVEATPEATRPPERITIAGSRRLVRVEGTVNELRAMAPALADAILDVGVTTDGPAPGLADEVRAFMPHALYVRAVFEREETSLEERKDVGLSDLYERYSIERHGEAPSEQVRAAFRELCEEVAIEL